MIILHKVCFVTSSKPNAMSSDVCVLFSLPGYQTVYVHVELGGICEMIYDFLYI